MDRDEIDSPYHYVATYAVPWVQPSLCSDTVMALFSALGAEYRNDFPAAALELGQQDKGVNRLTLK